MPGASSPMLRQSATIRSAPGLAMPCPLISETFGVMASEARAGPPGRRKVSMRGHERRRATASRVRAAEFQRRPPGTSTADPPMSAGWTPRCSRIAGRRWTPTAHVLRSATARGPGCTGQGLCILHETPPTVEYTHIPASSTHTSCSTRQVPPERPSPPPSGDAIKRPRRPGKSAHRWLRCHDTRPPQKPRDNTLAGLIARTHESSAARATPTSGTSAMPTTPRAKSRRS